MTAIPRRAAMGAIAAGVVIPSAVRASEPVIALVNEADAALDAYLDAGKNFHTLREKADNDPTRPMQAWEIAYELEEGSYDIADLHRQQDSLVKVHRHKYGADEAYDRWCALGKIFRSKVRFALNATVVSVEGIGAKVQLISDIEEYDGDTDLVIKWNELFTILARDLGGLS